MVQQGQQPVADHAGGGLLAADHRNDDVGNHLVLAQPIALMLRRHQGPDEALPRGRALPADRRAEVGGHLLQAAPHPRGVVRVVLEIAEHRGKIGRPRFQLVAIARGHAQHFGGHNGGQWIGQVRDHIHAALSVPAPLRVLRG